MAQQRGTHRAQPHSRKARPAFNFWPQGLWVCPRALAPHTCTAQNNSQTSLGKKCCGNPGNRPGEPTRGTDPGNRRWAGRRVPARPRPAGPPTERLSVPDSGRYWTSSLCLCLCRTGIVPLSLLHSGRRTQPQIKSKASQQEGEVAVV